MSKRRSLVQLLKDQDLLDTKSSRTRTNKRAKKTKEARQPGSASLFNFFSKSEQKEPIRIAEEDNESEINGPDTGQKNDT